MADAKVTIEAVVNNEEFKKLNNDLANGQQELKRLQAELKKAEKEFGVASNEAKELNAQLNAQRQINVGLARSIKDTISGIKSQGKAMQQSASSAKELANVISGQLGVDLSNLTGMLSKSSTGYLAVAAAVAYAGKELVGFSRDMSAFSNQFRTFAGSAEGAQEMYNLFNETYRNTNYDEAKVYDMAKGLMSVGISAKEANDLIMKVADTAASLGKGVEFADELADAFKRLATGGELTEKQYKSLAEAGIDLTDVQEQMRAGGTVAYEALKNKLAEYEGGMARSKQTAAEMEGDIKGNLIEIGRQTAELVDEFFGFSDSLREFYQWVIDTTGEVIASIKSMIAAMKNAKAQGDAWANAQQEWEDNYHDIWEQKRGEYASEAEWEAAKALAISNYCHATADVVVETEKRKREAIAETMAMGNKQVKSIAGGGKTAAGSSSSGGSKLSAKTAAVKTEDPVEVMRKQLSTMHALAMTHLENQHILGELSNEQYKEQMLAELEQYKLKCQLALQMENLTMEQRIAIETELAKTVQAINKNSVVAQTTTMKEAWAQAWEEVKVNACDQLATIQNGVGDIAYQLVNFGQNLITGTKSITEQIEDMCKNLANSILNMLMKIYMQGLLLKMIPGLSGLGFANGGYVGKYAEGGSVWGAGTSTSDSIPAMLSNGEYVLNARAVRAIGRDNLDRMNAAHFASGGVVGSGAAAGGLNVKFDLKNESGVPMEAKQTGSSFDGESYVISVVLNAVANNTNGMRTMLKGL